MNLENELVPTKLGHLAKDTDGNLVLVNPDGKAYAVDNDISTVWLMLDGQRTFHELINALSADAPLPAQEINSIVTSALERLRSVDLVTW